MNKQVSKLYFSSLGSKLGLFFAMVAFLLTALLIFQNFYAVNIIHEKVAKSFEGNLTQYMNQIDKDLDSIDKYLLSKFVNSLPLTIFEQGKEDSQYNLSLVDLKIEFSREISFLESAGGIFAYSTITEDIVAGLSPTAEFSLSGKDDLKAFLQAGVNIPNRNWFFQTLGDRDFLIRVLQINSYFFGAWIDVTTLIENFRPLSLSPQMLVFFVSEDNNIFPENSVVHSTNIELDNMLDSYFISGNPVRYLVIGTHSSMGEFHLTGIIPDKEVLQQLSSFRLTNIFIALAVILLVLAFFILIRNAVLKPLHKITRAMVKLRKGDFDSRVSSDTSTREFALAGETFNNMASEIMNLRINVYEEQLHAQKAELHSLRLQIKPHFLLNSLNILYQMAQLKEYHLIQELSLCLSKYFRFMLKSGGNLVPLKEEWEHLNNYIRIHELRFPHHMKAVIDAQNQIPDIDIPPLLLHTFAENSVKHGIQQENTYHLSVFLSSADAGEHIKIVIEDNGPGFSPEVLEKFRKGEALSTGTGEHIGIDNIRQRLNIVYGNNASLQLLNRDISPGGAVVEIVLPLSPAE